MRSFAAASLFVYEWGREADPARIESVPDGIHDLVSFAPEHVATAVGSFIAEQR